LPNVSWLLSLLFHPDDRGSRFLRNVSEFYKTICCHILDDSTFEERLHKNARWVLMPVWLENHDRHSGIKTAWIQTFISPINGVSTPMFINCSVCISIPQAL
jgi:hypothetical protein